MPRHNRQAGRGMWTSLSIRPLLAAAIAVFALALPPAASAGSLSTTADALNPRHHLGPGPHLQLRHEIRRHPGLYRHLLLSHLRHHVYGASKVTVLDRRALSGRHPHRVVTIEEYAFVPLHKGGIFGFDRDTLVFLQPHRLARHGHHGAPSAPRKILAHGGHGLFAHRSHLFGGGLASHDLAGAPRLLGAHPRNIVVPLGHE